MSLQIYLAAALNLCREDQYPPAFAVLRAALEHHLIDRLLFLGRRYRQTYVHQKRADYETLEKDWKAGRPGTENIVRLDWKGGNNKDGTFEVVRTGLHPSGGTSRGLTLSIYYFLLEEFDPFVGHPKEQEHLARGFTPTEQHIQLAEHQQGIYKTLRWNEIKSNLNENRLATVEILRRFEVHYRFLSAFVHPVTAGYDLVYGRNRPTGAPRYDHYASELLLLYINKIASEELKCLKRMAARTPRVRLADWDSVEEHINVADKASAHLWFPGDLPDNFDYVEEANSRGLRSGKLVAADKRLSPAQLKVDQVRYYRNPLLRLIRMHSSFQELTGFAYQSPWPRDDARFR